MKGTLIIYILTITSSYSDNVELPSNKYYDVLEFWITDSMVYRSKTFSMDSDIHVYSFKVENRKSGLEIATKTTQANYGDITKEIITIELKGNETREQLDWILTDKGMNGKFEMNDFVFWNPDGRNYSTKSKPDKL